jgi:hypothetical protein
VSVEQGHLSEVYLAVFSTALEARVYDRLAGKAARPECHRFMSINRLQAILKHVLVLSEGECIDPRGLETLKHSCLVQHRPISFFVIQRWMEMETVFTRES